MVEGDLHPNYDYDVTVGKRHRPAHLDICTDPVARIAKDTHRMGEKIEQLEQQIIQLGETVEEMTKLLRKDTIPDE